MFRVTHRHHQEPKTALAAFGFACVEGFWTCGCWTLSHHASLLNRARNSRCTVITVLDTSKRSTQKAFSCCDAIFETGPAVSMRSELLVAHEKLGQLPLLTVVGCARVR